MYGPSTDNVLSSSINCIYYPYLSSRRRLTKDPGPKTSFDAVSAEYEVMMDVTEFQLQNWALHRFAEDRPSVLYSVQNPAACSRSSYPPADAIYCI